MKCSRCKKRERAKGSWCRECHNSANREAWSNQPESKRKDKWLRNKYGKTYEWYIDTWEDQFRECPICREPIHLSGPSHPRKACVDHCHETGEVRGLLCNHCNRGLGLLGDSPYNTRRATKYLERYKDDE